MSSLDFDKVLAGHEVSVKIEKSESDGDANIRRIKELVLMACAVFATAVFLWICYQTVTSTTASPDEKRWAQSIITAALCALIAAVVKK